MPTRLRLFSNCHCVTVLALALALCAPIPAFAWGHTGHMVVAQIAYDNLSDKARAKAGELIAVKVEPQKLVVNLPGGRKHTVEVRPRTGSFVTAACWADDVKSNTDREWHYHDQPFSADGTTPQLHHTSGDAVTALKRCQQVLRGSATKKEKARQLRYLIHLAGDIHQPLHCATRCTENRPEGDRGGNDFPLIGADNLHSYWDSGAKLFPGSLERPLDQAGVDKVKALAAQCVAGNPRSAFTAPLAVKDVQAWADEGYALAVSHAYGDIDPGDKPSAAYVTRAQNLSKKQVALAGYRLAELLNGIFK